ncbi:hypothetical protein HYDPIDRAFT_170757 [Hydnomerulius pinastri MD-312]|uniref:Uncharacterized protein n=1 Tax=Hydnomerulius pinastri MD-312 TaxID=994086 RepID=A0A0C9V2L3_9AGAM|nr:hypothetical protein HYDPIDRAFT_170757 [Hydnomerulius pinastri MD-312]
MWFVLQQPEPHTNTPKVDQFEAIASASILYRKKVHDMWDCLPTCISFQLPYPTAIMSALAKHRATSPLPNLKADEQPAIYKGQNCFTVADITALFNSPFAQDFSGNERQAAIRAILRHGAHCDGAHFHTRTPGGLHPAYAAFNHHAKLEKKLFSRTEFVEASLSDVFDAITMHDRLDGGISVLIRCPGSEAGLDLMSDKITVDLYVTPRELIQNEPISGDTAVLIQAFCQEFAVPHLHRFNERCKVEAIKSPKPWWLAEPISPEGPKHLPPPLSPDVF